LKSDLGCGDMETLFRHFDIDGKLVFDANYIGAAPLTPPHLASGLGVADEPADNADSDTDVWGVKYSDIQYGTGAYREVAHHPLADAQSPQDVHRHRWPCVDDFDFSRIAKKLDNHDSSRIVLCGWYEPFLIYCAMRGMEQSFEDLLCNPEIADAILGHLFDFFHEFNRRLFEAGKGRIDLTYVAEDLGGQTGPLMSLEVYRRFLLPNQIKMADLARRYNIHIIYHTDGAARIFLPDLVDRVGIELLNPIQWRCPGMDRVGLVRDFGRQIIFHGAVDNQQTLSFGTVDDVIAEVRQTRDIFSKCRWICGPCHNLQPVTPTANIYAMYQTINES
jgi:uroporphyrinogen decarboxylase